MSLEKIKWNFQNIPYGPDSSQKFDMACVRKDVHAIVYIHGGAYFTGNRFQYPSFLADYSENNLFATIDYRVVNAENEIEISDILHDVNDALLKIIELSKENGINIKDFILTGHSAGGHIALLYAYKYFQKNEDIEIAACISLAGPTDFTDDTGWSSMGMWGEDIQTRLAFLSWMGTRLTGYKKITGKSMELIQFNWTKQKNFPDYKKHIEDISPLKYASEMEEVPFTLLVHARSDNQVPYSNAVSLKTVLNKKFKQWMYKKCKLITPDGNADSHMLGGEVYTEDSPFIFKNRAWVSEVKEWINDIWEIMEISERELTPDDIALIYLDSIMLADLFD